MSKVLSILVLSTSSFFLANCSGGHNSVSSNSLLASSGNSNSTSSTNSGSGPGTGTTGISSNCGNRAYTFCDDFETGPVDLTASTSVWTKTTNGAGTAVIDSTHAFSGKYSYHATIPNAGGWAMITADAFPSGPVTSFWGRAMMYIATTPSQVHSDYIVADALLPASAGYPPYMVGTSWAISDQFDLVSTNIKLGASGNGSEYGTHFTPKFTVGAWTCVEWYFDDSNQNASVLNIYLNGNSTPLAGNSNIPTNVSFTFRTLTLGVIQWGTDTNTGGYDYWYDDVATSSTRIGCESGTGY